MTLHHLCNKQREKVLFKPNHKEKRQPLTIKWHRLARLFTTPKVGVGGGEGREGGSQERHRDGQTGRQRWSEGRRKKGVRERPALPIQYTAGGLGRMGWGVGL